MSKNNVIENAKKHYVERLSHPTVIRVDEWDTDIYVYPLTLSQHDKLVELMDSKESSVAQAVSILIMLAKDKDGSHLFKDEDRNDLMNAVDPKVVMRISQEMAVSLNPDEDEVKNV